MQRRFTAWALLAVAMLGGSAVFGWLLTAAIGPRSPDYNRMWGGGGGGARTVQVAPQPPVRRAFTSFQPAQPIAGAQAQEFKRVVDSIARAAAGRQRAPLLAAFDAARMAEEESPLGFYALLARTPTRADLDVASSDIARDIGELIGRRPDIFPVGDAEIVKVSWSPDRQEALVLAKHSPKNVADGPRGGVRFVRWWLKRDPVGTWRAYDFDFPNSRLRFLAIRNYLLDTSVHELAVPGAAEAAPDVAAFHGYQYAFDWLMLAGSVADPAANSAAAWAEPIESVQMISYVQAARYALRARQEALRGKAVQVEANYNRAVQLSPVAAHVILARAVLMNAQKNAAGARAAIAQYRESVGDDPIAYLEDAKAAAPGGPKAAIEVLRKGLTVFPGDTAIAMELARRLPADERENLGAELAVTADAMFLATAATLFEKQFPSILDALATGWLRAKPDDPTALRVGIQSKLALGQLAAAGERLKRASADERRSIADLLFGRAAIAPSPVEYYTVVASVGEARRAFRRIVPYFANGLLVSVPPPDGAKRIENLKALVAAHRTHEPNDPFLHYGEAVALAAAGDAVKADAELVAGMAKLTPPKRTERLPLTQRGSHPDGDWAPFLGLRTELLFKHGKWKRAYVELRPVVDTFDQLANRLAAERDEFALAELIELHAKAYPLDLELIAWRGEVSFLKMDHENAVKFFKDYRDKSGKENRQYYRMVERLIRSLVRLKRIDEAAEVLAEANDSFPYLTLLQVLVAAARGDADAVMEQFDRAGKQLNPGIWYSDPDLGPLLRGPAFDRVRQKYPPPVR